MSTPPDDSRPAFVPRPAQARILAYTGGPMGISAVPGSDKKVKRAKLLILQFEG